MAIPHNRFSALFGAETNQFQWFLKEQLARESARQGLYLPIQGVRSTEDKSMRVETLQPDVKNDCILFRRDQTMLLQQISQFPLGAHDAARTPWRAPVRCPASSPGRRTCPAFTCKKLT